MEHWRSWATLEQGAEQKQETQQCEGNLITEDLEDAYSSSLCMSAALRTVETYSEESVHRIAFLVSNPMPVFSEVPL